MRIIAAAMLIVVIALILVGCEGRDPITQAQAAAIADNMQRRENIRWGDPILVLPPGENVTDNHGHAWWQVRYADGPDKHARVIIVDDETGWPQFPDPSYILRLPPIGKPGADAPVRPIEGNVYLVLGAPVADDAGHTAELQHEVDRLNQLADGSGLLPLFAVKHGLDVQLHLIYGWNGQHGIARDDRVVDWITARTPYRDCRWVDLTPP